MLKNKYINVYEKDSTLIVKLKKKNITIGTSPFNGGIIKDVKYIFNQNMLSQTGTINEKGSNYKEHIRNHIKDLGLDTFKTMGLATAVDINKTVVTITKEEDLEVISLITAGTKNNSVSVGDEALYYEKECGIFKDIGTINIIVILNFTLTVDALVKAIMIVTEAKAYVFNMYNIRSNYSNKIATGTGTDGIVISSSVSNKLISEVSTHSKVGELIGKNIIEGLTSSLNKEYNNKLSDIFNNYYKYKNYKYTELDFKDLNEDSYLISKVKIVIRLVDLYIYGSITKSEFEESYFFNFNKILKYLRNKGYYKNTHIDCNKGYIENLVYILINS